MVMLNTSIPVQEEVRVKVLILLDPLCLSHAYMAGKMNATSIKIK